MRVIGFELVLGYGERPRDFVSAFLFAFSRCYNHHIIFLSKQLRFSVKCHEKKVQYLSYIPKQFTLLSSFVICVFCPYFAGWIYDITHKYDFSFYICGSLYLVGILFLFMQPYIGKKQSQEKSTEEAQV